VALGEAGIRSLVLKGWALIPTLYGGDYGQRTYSDIDVLVLPGPGSTDAIEIPKPTCCLRSIKP
jgi:hypothetical protein